jgi:hypothetical protein
MRFFPKIADRSFLMTTCCAIKRLAGIARGDPTVIGEHELSPAKLMVAANVIQQSFSVARERA